MAKAAKKPEHKPSKKVALDEVLASLQDLVQNEFADENAIPDSESPELNPSPNVLTPGSSKKRKRGRPPKNGAEKKAGLKKKSSKQPAQAASPADADDYTYSQDQADLFVELPAANSKQKSVARKKTPKITAKSVKPTLETDRNQANLRVVDNKKSVIQQEEKLPQMANKLSNTAEKLPEESGLNWASDIPVLTEAVDPAEFDASEFQDAVNQSLENKDLSPEARQIAVKVAAKLNIEMRESGGEQLDIKTIMRLQSLLKEALEPKD